MEELLLTGTERNDSQSFRMGFLRHMATKIIVQKDCLSTILPYCNFVQVEFIPDSLLPGRACFRFDSAHRRYNDSRECCIFAKTCQAISGQSEKCQAVLGQRMFNL
jgi:hypothetical protein